MTRKVVDENTFNFDSGLNPEELIEEFNIKDEKEREELLEKLEENIREINEKLSKTYEELTEKFKGWIIENEVWKSNNGLGWWNKWKLKDPKTREVAIVVQSVKFNEYSKEFTTECFYEIFTEDGSKLVDEKVF